MKLEKLIESTVDNSKKKLCLIYIRQSSKQFIFNLYDTKYEIGTTIIILILQIGNWSIGGYLSKVTQWFWVHWEDSLLRGEIEFSQRDWIASENSYKGPCIWQLLSQVGPSKTVPYRMVLSRVSRIFCPEYVLLTLLNKAAMATSLDNHISLPSYVYVTMSHWFLKSSYWKELTSWQISPFFD